MSSGVIDLTLHEHRPSSKNVATTKLERRATCGACGTERAVSASMRRDYDAEFHARPDVDTDLFYCGCQRDEDSRQFLEPSGDGGW